MELTNHDAEQINATLAGMTEGSVEDDPFVDAVVETKTVEEKEEPKMKKLTTKDKLARIEKNYARLLDAYQNLQKLNAALIEENAQLKKGRQPRITGTEHIPNRSVAAPKTQEERIDITALAQESLPNITNTPFTPGTCTTHGTVRSNKWKKCFKCGNEAAKQAWADNYANRK